MIMLEDDFLGRILNLVLSEIINLCVAIAGKIKGLSWKFQVWLLDDTSPADL